MLAGTKSPWIIFETLLVAAGASLVLAASVICVGVLLAGIPTSTPLTTVGSVAAALYAPIALLLVRVQLRSPLTAGERKQLRVWAMRFPPVYAALCRRLTSRAGTTLGDYFALQHLAVRGYWDEEAIRFRARAHNWHLVPSRRPHQSARRAAHQRQPSRLPKRPTSEVTPGRYRESKIA